MSIKMPFVPPLPTSSTGVGAWPAIVGIGNSANFDILNQFSDHRTAETVMKMEETLVNVDEKIRRTVIHRLRVENRREKREQLDGIEQKLASLKLENEILNELTPWWTGPLHLQRPNGSAFHRLSDAIQKGDIKILLGKVGAHNGKLAEGAAIGSLQSFVIEHDWAKAFESAKEFDGGEIRLPYERMCFEFFISGKRVCALVSGEYDPERVCPVIETKCAGWVLPQFVYERTESGVEPGKISGNKKLDAMRHMVLNQIRAVCISLDAEVTTTEIVRAPHKLNHAREKLGRMPLVDYHVVKLAHRTRAASLPETTEGEKRSRHRLHFRRGHWRHFTDHKTWIKWMLVGDPDLGFIDKHYRL